jgi:hypothetical protein
MHHHPWLSSNNMLDQSLITQLKSHPIAEVNLVPKLHAMPRAMQRAAAVHA